MDTNYLIIICTSLSGAFMGVNAYFLSRILGKIHLVELSVVESTAMSIATKSEVEKNTIKIDAIKEKANYHDRKVAEMKRNVEDIKYLKDKAHYHAGRLQHIQGVLAINGIVLDNKDKS